MDWPSTILTTLLSIPGNIVSTYLYDKFFKKRLNDSDPPLFIYPRDNPEPTVNQIPDPYDEYRSKNNMVLKRWCVYKFSLAGCAYFLLVAIYLPLFLFGGGVEGLDLSKLRWVGKYINFIVPNNYVIAFSMLYAFMFFVPFLKLSDWLVKKINRRVNRFEKISFTTWLSWRVKVFLGICVGVASIMVFLITDFSCATSVGLILLMILVFYYFIIQ